VNDSTKDKFDIVIKLINIALLLLLGILGYRVNSQLTDLQNISENRNISKDTKIFWTEIFDLVKEDSELSEIICNESRRLVYLLSYFEEALTIKERESVVSSESFKKVLDDYYNANYEAGICVSRAVSNYQEILLKYSSLAKDLDIENWDRFIQLNQEIYVWGETRLKYLRERRNKVDDLIYKGRPDNTELFKAHDFCEESTIEGLPYIIILKNIITSNIRRIDQLHSK